MSANGPRIRFFRDIANVTMDLNEVERITVHAFAGTDTVTVNDLTGTDAKTVDVDLAALGGAGDGAADTVVVNGTAGPDKVKVAQSGGGARGRRPDPDDRRPWPRRLGSAPVGAARARY